MRRVSGAVNCAGPGGSQRFERAANTTGIMSGLLGGTSSFVWGKQIKRNIDEKEKALNVAKANDSWRNYVSGGCPAGHAYLRRGSGTRRRWPRFRWPRLRLARDGLCVASRFLAGSGGRSRWRLGQLLDASGRRATAGLTRPARSGLAVSSAALMVRR